MKKPAAAGPSGLVGEIRKWQAKGITPYEDLADMPTGKIKTPPGAEYWQPI